MGQAEINTDCGLVKPANRVWFNCVMYLETVWLFISASCPDFEFFSVLDERCFPLGILALEQQHTAKPTTWQLDAM